MALTNEDIQAIGQLLDSKLNPIKEDVQTLKEDVQTLKEGQSQLKEDVEILKEDVQTLKAEQSQLRDDLRKTEGNLKEEIQKECGLVLDEVERVHNILDRHKADTTKHTA